MRSLNSDSVDLIYLDPPFNSKKTYSAPIGSKAAHASFKDFWTFDDVDRLWLELLRYRKSVLYDVIQATRTAHGDGMAAYVGMMAQRLQEMKRLLKPTGSIYLHCDPTASHYLKMLMDAMFGKGNFKNEIIWKRTNAPTASPYKLGSVHDTILLYAKSKETKVFPVFIPYTQEYITEHYKYKDDKGRYQVTPLTAQGVRYGYSGKLWRGVDVTVKGLHWVCPISLPDSYGIPKSWPDMNTLEKLDWLDANGMIYWPKGGNTPRFKRYLSTSKGVRLSDVIIDIAGVQGASQERVGYPTQKPLKLLDRIIKASSNLGDVVLDPFCGCATTCVSAEIWGRQWIGIDIGDKAVELVEDRLQKTVDRLEMYKDGDVIHRTDQPHRTDMGNLPNYRVHLDALYGSQGGNCGGCGEHFMKRNVTIYDRPHRASEARWNGPRGKPVVAVCGLQL